MTEIPKPFGLPDEQGFYKVHSSNELALMMARNLVEIWSHSLEYLALSGYVMCDYPENTPEEEYDRKYHLLLGLDQNLSESAKEALFKSNPNKQFKQAYEFACDGMYWNHGPLKMVTVNYDTLKEELYPGTLHFSLVFSAIPLWEKPEVKKSFGKYQLSPFEYIQQYFFQFHAHPERKDAVYVSRVTGDEADRFILTKE